MYAFQTRLRSEMNKVRTKELASYFNLQNNIRIDHEPLHGEVIDVRISYHKKKENYEIEELPEDINRYIRSFLPNKKIEFDVEILFPFSYPFDPPVWKLQWDKLNVIGFPNEEKKKIYSFLSYKIKVHNSRKVKTKIQSSRRGIHRYKILADNWSPSCSFQSDILTFYTTIHCLFELYEKQDYIE
jgi:hypothetical protein